PPASSLHLHSFPIRRSSDLLQAQPYFRYRHNNYCCEITAVRGVFQILSTHYVGFAEFEDRADTYTPFVKAFVRNLKSQNPSCIRSEEHTSELQSRENLVCRL